jgi:hypothetical protein
MTDEEEAWCRCRALVDKHRSRLADLARDTIDAGMNPEEFVLVCLDAEVPAWQQFVEEAQAAYGIEDADSSVLILALDPADVFATFLHTVPGIAAVLSAGRPDGAIAVLSIAGDDDATLFMEKLDSRALSN